MKKQIHILHVRDRWGGNTITVWAKKANLLMSLAEFITGSEDTKPENYGSEMKEIAELIAAGKFDEAESRIDEEGNCNGHEWTTRSETIDPADFEPASEAAET